MSRTLSISDCLDAARAEALRDEAFDRYEPAGTPGREQGRAQDCLVGQVRAYRKSQAA